MINGDRKESDMTLKIVLKGGEGSGHHGHGGSPGIGGSTAGTGGGGAFGGEETIRKYEMKRNMDYVSGDYATRVMSSAMRGIDKLSPAQKGKVVNLRKLKTLEKKRRSDLHKERAIVVPNKGPFEGIPMQVKGYALRVGGKGVTKWKTSPIGPKRKMLKIEVDIPNEDFA